MFRKLILLAITSGLARKVWDGYRRKSSSPLARARTRPGSGRGWFG